jgi:hypothetical protein
MATAGLWKQRDDLGELAAPPGVLGRNKGAGIEELILAQIQGELAVSWQVID